MQGLVETCEGEIERLHGLLDDRVSEHSQLRDDLHKVFFTFSLLLSRTD